MGGSLYPEIRDLPGRMNHRMPPEGTIEEKFALRHAVTFTEGGPFHRLFGATEVMTNTLHGQGIKRPGSGSSSTGMRPMARPRRSMSRARRASPCRCSGIPSTARRRTR
jgi:putative glutamine amidotransferase